MNLQCRYCGRTRQGDPCQSCVDAGLPESKAGVKGSYNPESLDRTALESAFATRVQKAREELDALIRQAAAMNIAPAAEAPKKGKGKGKKGGNS